MATEHERHTALALDRHPPESLSDYALRSLREDLIEGRLIPGQRVAAEAIAASLSISHVPVREAMRYLEAEGHLQRDPRSQVRVAPVTPDEAEEIYRLRALLEAEALRAGVPELDATDFELLDRYFNEMTDAVRVADIAQFASANRQFHFVAFARTGNTWMLRFLNIIWDAAARYQTSLFQRDGWEENLQRHHDQLRIAMRRKNIDEVNRIMDAHRQVTVEATQLLSAVDHGADGESK